MLFHLRKKLTFLYTLTTGLILSTVVFALAFITQQSDNRQEESMFTNQLMTIANKLQYDSRISQHWLASMEIENQLIIHIEENNKPLLYPGSFFPATDRSKLLDLARQKASEESIDTSQPPVSTSLVKSSLFSLTGVHKDHYQGTVMVFTTSNSYFTLILIKDVTAASRQLYLSRILFIIADIIGIFFLMLVNWYFVGKLLKPVQENQEKQHTFIAAASHELRSPLAVIRASADAIPLKDTDPAYFVASIKNECTRMSRLIQDLLLLASAKSSSFTLAKEPIDLDTLLLTTFERYEPLCAAKQLSLLLDLPEDSFPALLGDGERISHILSVLLDNALYYSPAGSSISLKAFLQKQSLICEVIDHGSGIPDSQKEKVFDYFYRSDSSRKDKNHFGLGLSVAAELTRLCNGRLELSDTPGGGCTFCLLLPLEPN